MSTDEQENQIHAKCQDHVRSIWLLPNFVYHFLPKCSTHRLWPTMFFPPSKLGHNKSHPCFTLRWHVAIREVVKLNLKLPWIIQHDEWWFTDNNNIINLVEFHQFPRKRRSRMWICTTFSGKLWKIYLNFGTTWVGTWSIGKRVWTNAVPWNYHAMRGFEQHVKL